MSDIPFKYGQVVSGSNFTNRNKEIKLLSSNFENLINTILISPRKWGKTSLVKRAAQTAMNKNKSINVCFLDLYKVRTEEEFYEQLTYEVLKSTAGKMAEISNNIKMFFKQFVPKISYSPMEESDFSISLDWENVKKNPDEILNLAETIARKKKIKLIICIDEFQNLGFFKDAVAFQKRLRANWQNHQQVTYCMYGSKRHMMMEVFTDRSMPFYQFGSLIFLEKISNNHWVKYITKQFKKTGKLITNENASQIAKIMKNHPYYVQQLAHICWLNTNKICEKNTITIALEQLLMQLSLLFQNLTDTLSSKQLNLLKAIVHNEKEISSKKAIKKYNLGTSATVNRSKNALIDKEILDNFSNETSFVDPAFRAWLTTYYFKVKY